MVQQCLKATEQLDQHVLDNLMLEVTDTFKQVDNPSMKEVKGIEDRLYGLDQILNGARKIVQEQSDLAQVKKTSSVYTCWPRLFFQTFLEKNINRIKL